MPAPLFGLLHLVEGEHVQPSHDRAGALRRQRELVELELERLGATARALDAASSLARV